MQQPQPPPCRPRHGDQADRHHQRPAEVQRRHRGELVRQLVGVGRPVDRRPVQPRGVHQSRHRQQPGRGQRIRQVQHQRGRGDRRQRAPGPDVVPRAAQVQPDQEGRGGREVDGRVVGVGELDERVAVQQRGLHRALPGQMQRPLQVPDLTTVAVRLGGVAGREPAAQLVDEEQARHQQQFADERRPVAGTGSRRLGFLELLARVHAPGPFADGGACRGAGGAADSGTGSSSSVRTKIDTRTYRYASVPIRQCTDTLPYRYTRVSIAYDTLRRGRGSRTDDVAGRGPTGTGRCLAPLQDHA